MDAQIVLNKFREDNGIRKGEYISEWVATDGKPVSDNEILNEILEQNPNSNKERIYLLLDLYYNTYVNINNSGDVVEVSVCNIDWDADDEDDLNEIPDNITFAIPVVEYSRLNENDLNEMISDTITEITGFCHKGWESFSISTEKMKRCLLAL